MSHHDGAPAPVVERRDVIEIDERMLASGEAAKPLDRSVAQSVLRTALGARPYRAVAICLLNAYANPAHEQAVAAIVRDLFPDMVVSCSSDISREFREYERASTTALAAYVQPIIDGYLARFESRLAREGFRGRFSIMQSNGGRLPAAAIRRNAITALFSGPAAGVTGALRQAGASGYDNLVTFDMGGTSTDVCLVTGGKPVIAPETAVDGLPIRTPVVDIASVGAGGGSIVWRDPGGMLRVGPRSAGADPGPACYGRGGTQPTITDAHVIRGTIDPDSFLGGRMKLDVAAARAAFGTLAQQFEMSLEAIADSAIRLADANVVRAIQLISTELGRDPRDYVLAPFGGAGPLHAGRIAEELGIGTIVVPQNAGVLSAYGLLAADYTQFETATRKLLLDTQAPATVNEVFASLEERMRDRFAALGMHTGLIFARTLQMRFVGQAFEIDVPLPEGALTEAGIRDAFDTAHRLVYFHGGGAGLAGKRVEVVGFRIGASVPERCDLPNSPPAASRPPRERVLYEQRERRTCTLLTRAHVAQHGSMSGPLLIEDETATIYVPPRWQARSDRAGNLILTRDENTR